MEFKYNFAFFIKTYIDDINRFHNLISSIIKYNRDNIPVFISVPSKDYSNFNVLIGHFKSSTINLFKDEDICNELIEKPINDFAIGYINQQISKLTFWQTKLAEYYLCLDSDLFFIKDFFINDFMFNSQTPYVVLQEDKDLSLDASYKGYYSERKAKIKSIFNKIGINNNHIKTSHGNTILSSKVLKSLKKDYLNNQPYYNLLIDESFEFSWYNAWLQKTELTNYISCEQFFKVFHTKDQYFNCLRLNSEENIKKEYLGICLNSNWADKLNIFKYGYLPKNRMFMFKIEKKLHKLISILRKI